MTPRPSVAFSPYTVYSRDEWAALRADTQRLGIAPLFLRGYSARL